MRRILLFLIPLPTAVLGIPPPAFAHPPPGPARPPAVLAPSLPAAEAGGPAQRMDPEDLPEEHRVWLEEEVAYIITDVERDVFLSLGTREERVHFIEAFWQRRDPAPATPGNEFRDEHYERFDYANRFLGREAPRPGWQTDRGRFWIILGKPQTREQFDGMNEIVSADLWTYSGDTALGLPPRFNLLFFRKEDIGEYELYNPLSDGPDALVRRGELLRNRQNAAVDILEIVSMDLARASLVVDLTDPTGDFLQATNTISPRLDTVRPSMSVNKNLMDIEASPQRRVDLDEIEGYLRYGNRVTAEYSFRFVNSRALFLVLFGPRDVPFIHYELQIAPEDFTLERDEESNAYRTTLEVELELATPDGRVVAVQRNEPFVELTASQHQAAAGSPFAYRDNLPVLPGDYVASVLLRNRATRQYTVATGEVRVPSTGAGRSGLSDVVVAYRVDESQALSTETTFGTFQFGAATFSPALDGAFASADTVHAAVQPFGASGSGRVRFRMATDEPGADPEELAQRTVTVGAGAGGAAVVDFPLAGVAPGRYRLLAELLGEDGSVAASTSAPLGVSPRSSVERPAFTLRRSFGVHVPGLLALTLGDQFMAAGRIPEAVVALREASQNPDLPMARWKLASALLFERRADEALELLLPFETDHPNEIEVVEGVGFAYYVRRECGEALPRLRHALTLRPPDTSLLNALGDCYGVVGDGGLAREMFERSLELNAEQPGVLTRLAELRESPPDR